MSLDRRTMLKNVGLGAASVASIPGMDINAAAKSKGLGPKRIVFFLQNQGFDPNQTADKFETRS